MYGHVMHHLHMLCLALALQGMCIMCCSMSMAGPWRYDVILRVVTFIAGIYESVMSCVCT